MWMQRAPPQNALVNKRPSEDVRGISRRRAERMAPAPINRAWSPRPNFTRTSGGTDPRTFSDPVTIISPPIRTCRTRPAIRLQLLRPFIVLLLDSQVHVGTPRSQPAGSRESSAQRLPPDHREPHLRPALRELDLGELRVHL